MYSLYLQNPDKFEYSVNGPEPTGPDSGYGIAIGNHLKAKPYWPVLLAASMVITLIWYGNPGISITSSLIFLIGFIGCLTTFSQEKKRKNQELANSPEYLQAVAMARQQAASQQAQNELRVRQEQERLDAQHAAEVEHYNRVVLPAFEQRLEECRREYAEMRIACEQDKAEWESKRDSAVALLEKDIASNEDALGGFS